MLWPFDSYPHLGSGESSFVKLLWPLSDIQTDGCVDFSGLNRAYTIAVILILLWLLQDIQTDGLVGFTGPNRDLLGFAF